MGSFYPLYQDIHVMVFIGFGFLMTFVHTFSWSAVGMNFLLSALCVQWSMLTIGFFNKANSGDWSFIHIDVVSLIGGDFAAAAAMISLGAVLGKTSSTQLLVMVFFEMIFYGANEMFVYKRLKAIDVGGSLTIHTFGAYFGLAVSWMLGPPTLKEKAAPTYTKWSSTLSMVGTIFLWCFWPSFNGALAVGSQQHRVIINTILSISGSCIAALYAGRLLRPSKKFDFEELQNATLAGGVAVGCAADLVLRPWGAMLLGNVAGILSTIGFIYLSPFLLKHARLHDTCGVNNLHGMPGILGGIAGAISSATAGSTIYGLNIGHLFPARAPSDPVAAALEGVAPGIDRTASGQGGYQAAAIFVSLCMGLAGGLLTGFIMSFKIWDEPAPKMVYQDEHEWHVGTEVEGPSIAHGDAAEGDHAHGTGASSTSTSAVNLELPKVHLHSSSPASAV